MARAIAFAAAPARFLVMLLVLGFVTTSIVRLAPGYGTDERELDSRLSNESIDAVRIGKGQSKFSRA